MPLTVSKFYYFLKYKMVYCAVCYTKSTDRIKIHLNQWQDHPFEASLVDETNGIYKSKLRTGIDALIELMEILEVNGWTLVSTNKEDTYIFRKVFETIVDDTPEVVIEKTSKFRGVTHDLQSTNPWCAAIHAADTVMADRMPRRRGLITN